VKVDAGPHTPRLSSIRADGSRLPIHPLEVRGRFIRFRRATFAALIAIYLAAPLVKIGGHPAIHLDVEARRFYLLGGTFNAQDFWMVLLLAVGFVFSVLFVTAWRGRVWCGWACPQTVFLEGVYRQVERLFDGPSARRSKPRPLNVPRTFDKHLAWLLVSVGIAHVAAALFVSIAELAAMIREGPAAHPVAFAWTTAFTVILQFNFAWFREQFCVVLCPYGRLQSLLHDKESITVAYDSRRGEPRGKLKLAAGACVDCRKCVAACPTAIDIRDGLQMECLACAQCVDACDEVMEKVGRPKGLIRYASMNELDGKPRRVVRPRLFIYAALAALSVGTLGVALERRTAFEAGVARLRGIPFVVEGDRVRNQFDVHLVNKAPGEARFTLALHGPEGMEVSLGSSELRLGSLENTHVPLVVSLPLSAAHGTQQLSLEVRDGEGDVRTLPVPFLGPRSR
jgi:cytochrome c oxidase accessory protein FixG